MNNNIISELDLKNLFLYYFKNSSQLNHKQTLELEKIQHKIEIILSLDDNFEVINNFQHSFCPSYPNSILIWGNENIFDSKKESMDDLNQIIRKSRLGRARNRFPISVISIQNKIIARSSTISSEKELFFKANTKLKNFLNEKEINQIKKEFENQKAKNFEKIKIRRADVSLLNQLKIVYIMDLMVEYEKKKFGFIVSSSEKKIINDFPEYQQFQISCCPYPGIELFRNISENKYSGENIKYNWENSRNNVEVSISPFLQEINLIKEIDFSKFKEWDLLKLTQNYFMLFLLMVSDPHPNRGVNIHCISGYDRTPLFISILRCSLWADGVIHQSMSVDSFLYFCIAYDWMLFSHLFKKRLEKRAEILAFSFQFLSEIQSQSFSFNHFQQIWSQHINNSKIQNSNENDNLDLSSNSQIIDNKTNFQQILQEDLDSTTSFEDDIPIINHSKLSSDSQKLTENIPIQENEKREEKLQNLRERFFQIYNQVIIPLFSSKK
ncbi:myotubularin-related protein [Anaeramoeba ignava]|uniref:Myotubularin-related protein n=1 Tax=Anaeramoeba ignava TaxID=1746090 RepID=A0A9Q0LF73_ANAIG|nr:myotubularin-related protein [Anaeramoeba ignava]